MNILLFFIIGVICGYFFTNIGYRLPVDINLLSQSKCDNCGHNLNILEKIPVISYIIQKGKCNYCNQKISKLYIFFEIITGLLFSLIYIIFKEVNYPTINIIISLVFISSLVIITFSDLKYMLIPDEILIISSGILIVLKIFLGYESEEITSLLDAGYEIIFMLIEAASMFLIMFIIKKIGDLVFKKESLGGGDIKMMTLVAIVMGYKLSIVIIFIASFIALPISIFNAYKKNQVMIPFGPYLSIATTILYLCNINFDMILEFIH